MSQAFFVAAAMAFAHADEADRVHELPDVGPLTSKHYSGYFKLKGSDPANRLQQFAGASGKEFNIHYSFVESLNDPSTDPIVLWLNGGPGCSSLIGEWTENGPYMFTEFGKLINNTYSWAQSANMIYLESPVGVGFSYVTPNGDGLTIADNITSMLNYQSLRHFLIKFPQFNTEGRRLILSGESYAGHYIPTLADRVLEYGIKNPTFPEDKALGKMMKGFAVGNPCTGAPKRNPTGDPDADFCYVDNDWTLEEYYRSHAFGLMYNNGSNDDAGQANYDHYDILAPTCNLGDSNLFAKLAREQVPHMTVTELRKASRYLATPKMYERAAADDAMGAINPYGPCSGNFQAVYLNRMDVKKALHVDTSIDWYECGGATYHHTFTPKGNVAGMMHVYRKFFADAHVKKNWNIFMYSGDADTVVNFIQSQTVVENMAGKKMGAMNPWYYRDTYNSSYKQLGGWYQDFEHMQWASVKGCGHMVPGYCPYKAYGLFESILAIGKAGNPPRLFDSPTLAPGLIPVNECPGADLKNM